MNKNYIIQKKYLHYVVSEFEIMKSLSGFPFVIDLHYCFQSANYLFMVIDICPGGDFDNLKYVNQVGEMRHMVGRQSCHRAQTGHQFQQRIEYNERARTYGYRHE